MIRWELCACACEGAGAGVLCFSSFPHPSDARTTSLLLGQDVYGKGGVSSVPAKHCLQAIGLLDDPRAPGLTSAGALPGDPVTPTRFRAFCDDHPAMLFPAHEMQVGANTPRVPGRPHKMQAGG